jgi:hypothetical protein
MADVLVKPAFQSGATDTGDASKLGPNGWNAARLFTGGNDGEVITRSAASATGAAWVDPLASRTLFTNVVPASTTILTEETLMSYTLPAGALAVNGRGVRFTTRGVLAANGNTKTIRLYFGATAIAVLSGTGASVWAMNGWVWRTGAATQMGSADQAMSGIAIWTPGAGTTPAETLSGTVLIKVTGTAPTAVGDITARVLMVEAI